MSSHELAPPEGLPRWPAPAGSSRVRAIAAGRRGPGAHSLLWDLRDDAGGRVAPGVYLARLGAGGANQVRRVAVMR